jgi:hypothetical protein
MLTVDKAWNLKEGETIVFRQAHYTLTDDPQVGRPSVGWTSLRTKDRDGLAVMLMIEGDEDINVVRVRDYTNQIRSGQRRFDQRKRRY